jgi:LCP family protein required for cell wall assembly
MSSGPNPPPAAASGDTSGGDGGAARGRRPRRSRRQRVLLGLGVVALAGVLAVVAGVGYTWWRYNQIDRQDLALEEAGFGQPVNYLIVGSDSREVVEEGDPNASAFLEAEDTRGQRSDTIMIARVDAKAKTIDLLSFPRDLWIPISGTDGNERINTAYAIGGPQQLIDTIKADFDIDINHYVEIDFKSFKDIVGAIDGVPMYFEKPMRDRQSGLYVDEPGCVTLDGDQALAFSRARHLETWTEEDGWTYDGTGDLGRVTRQQVFVRKVVDRASDKAVGLDLPAANSLLSATVQNLSIDDEMGIDDLWTLGQQFREFDGEQLVTHTLPVIEWTTDGGASVLKLDQPTADQVLAIFRGEDPASVPQIDPSTVTLTIENGSGVSGQASEAEAAFESLGFVVASTGNAEEPSRSTIVRYAAGQRDVADAVASHLPSVTFEEDPTLDPGEVTVVTGRDFTTVTGVPAGSSGTGTDATARPSGTAGSSGTASGDGTTTTTNPFAEAVGVTPGEPPPGVSCG